MTTEEVIAAINTEFGDLPTFAGFLHGGHLQTEKGALIAAMQRLGQQRTAYDQDIEQQLQATQAAIAAIDAELAALANQATP